MMTTDRPRREKLIALRKANGYKTQNDFCKVIKISRSHYAQIETGDKNPNIHLARRILKALGYNTLDAYDDVFENVR